MTFLQGKLPIKLLIYSIRKGKDFENILNFSQLLIQGQKGTTKFRYKESSIELLLIVENSENSYLKILSVLRF